MPKQNKSNNGCKTNRLHEVGFRKLKKELGEGKPKLSQIADKALHERFFAPNDCSNVDWPPSANELYKKHGKTSNRSLEEVEKYRSINEITVKGPAPKPFQFFAAGSSYPCLTFKEAKFANGLMDLDVMWEAPNPMLPKLVTLVTDEFRPKFQSYNKRVKSSFDIEIGLAAVVSVEIDGARLASKGADDNASLRTGLVTRNRGDGVCDSIEPHAGDEASLGSGLTIVEDESNSDFCIKNSNSGVSGFTSVGYVIRLRGGGYTGLGNGSGGGGGLSSSGGAGFSSNEDDASYSSRSVDPDNRSNSSNGLSTVDDRGFGRYEWVRRTSTDTTVDDTDEKIVLDSESIHETSVGGRTDFYNKDGAAGTSKINLSMGDTDEHLANRREDDGFNLNRNADYYSSNRFDDCEREGRYDGSFNIGGDGGFSQRGGGRTFGGRGDDHYSQRDGGFGGGGDGGLCIRDNSGFAVRGDAGLGVREYDAFGSKRDGGFENRDSGSFGAGGDNGLGIRYDGGFGGRGDGGFYNRDGGGFNKGCNAAFNNRSDGRFAYKGGYSNMSNAVFKRKTDRHADSRGGLEGNSGGQEFNHSFNAVHNSSLNGQYNEYNQENRRRSAGYEG